MVKAVSTLPINLVAVKYHNAARDWVESLDRSVLGKMAVDDDVLIYRRAFDCYRSASLVNSRVEHIDFWLKQKALAGRMSQSIELTKAKYELAFWYMTLGLEMSFELSILVEEEIRHLPKSKNQVGIDLGVKTAIVTSDGESFNPDLKNEQRKVKHAQRAFSRTDKGSHRREKARLRLAKAHAKVADKRRDFLHKTSTSIIRDNQTIVVEDLAVKAMTASARGTVEKPGKNVRQKAGLNRGITNHSFGEFRSMLEYKAEWYGREIVVADRFYPSSKTCSNCGHLLAKLALSVRTWKCPSCGVIHDRDINAAKNLVVFALGHREKKNARGGPVAKLSSESLGRFNESRTILVETLGIPRL